MGQRLSPQTRLNLVLLVQHVLFGLNQSDVLQGVAVCIEEVELSRLALHVLVEVVFLERQEKTDAG